MSNIWSGIGSPAPIPKLEIRCVSNFVQGTHAIPTRDNISLIQQMLDYERSSQMLFIRFNGGCKD